MKRSLSLLVGLAAVIPGMAQTDISGYYLKNNGFDEQFNYDASVTGNVSGDVINEVYGWTNETTSTYTVAGTFAYNTAVGFNDSSKLPAEGYNGSEGGALGLTTGWGMQLIYTQEVTLPKGTYRLTSAYYNVGSGTGGSSLLAWLPTGGTAVTSSVKSFPVGEWLADELTFTLTEETTGRVRIGFGAIDGSSKTQAKILVDYVNLICDSMDKSALKSAIDSANEAYGSGTGVGASTLKEIIDRAQGIYDDPNASVADIIAVTQELLSATAEYLYGNSSETNPYDVTTQIVNADFENGTVGWTNQGFSTQTNSYFPGKHGTTYVERWVSIGSTISDASISQTLTELYPGKYRLTANAGNIQQSASQSAVNAGDPQTGVTLYAGIESVAVNDMNDYQIPFSVIDGDVEIGYKAENATGNWVTLDNFRLEYLGQNTSADYVNYLTSYIEEIRNEYLTLHVQTAARTEAESLISSVETLCKGEMDATLAKSAKADLDKAIAVLEASAEVFAQLGDELDYARLVLSWYESDADKVATLSPAIAEAEIAYANTDLTNDEIAVAATELTTAVKKVDKKVYTAQWSMGNVNDPTNSYYIGRTRQSKDWILFWEKGYGDNPKVFSCGNYTVNVDKVLEHAQTAFDFYSDVLKYITRGNSKTDTYKMVIRLRYEPTEWEASGSGVDDQIGLLTLTPWAIESRNWQTLYHEIGHCFQYQVHCDNGDQNGWMYAPGNGSGCAFWEQCAQWQAYKIMPDEQFTNEWFDGYLKNVHKHILHESPRYNNYFIQDYWTYLHGIEFMGRLWNESKNPEDAVEAYMRITGITDSEFNDEMYDCAKHFATWDIPALDQYGKSKVASRPQPTMRKQSDNSWRISADYAPENTGHNIIRLNTPSEATHVGVEFEGLNNQEGYRVKNPEMAEWRYGFVALLKDGSRVYSDMGKATYENPTGTLGFSCPDNCSRLYFVVSAGASKYWRQVWDDNDDNDEQWPYQVKFGNTNKYGSDNMPELTSVTEIGAGVEFPSVRVDGNILSIDRAEHTATGIVTDLSGITLAQFSDGTTPVSISLTSGVYILRLTAPNGRTLLKKLLVK